MGVELFEKDTPILITGGTGLVGSYVLRYLLALGYTQITASCRQQSSKRLVPDPNQTINWKECDLRDAVRTSELVRDQKMIIHSAALVSFKPRDAEMLFDVNVAGTANLVNLAMDAGCQRFVHISSISALGKSSTSQMVTETSEWSDSERMSNYARSKYLSELEVWRASHEGLSSIVLNPSLVIGGGYWDRGSCQLVRRIGSGLRYYPVGATGVVDVRDVARAAIRSLVHQDDGKKYIINGHNITYKQLFQTLAKSIGAPTPQTPIRGLTKQMALIAAALQSAFGIGTDLSRESITSTSKTYQYENRKSIDDLGLSYTSFEQLVEETSRCYVGSDGSNTDFGLLPLNRLDRLYTRLFP